MDDLDKLNEELLSNHERLTGTVLAAHWLTVAMSEVEPRHTGVLSDTILATVFVAAWQLYRETTEPITFPTIDGLCPLCKSYLERAFSAGWEARKQWRWNNRRLVINELPWVLEARKKEVN